MCVCALTFVHFPFSGAAGSDRGRPSARQLVRHHHLPRQHSAGREDQPHSGLSRALTYKHTHTQSRTHVATRARTIFCRHATAFLVFAALNQTYPGFTLGSNAAASKHITYPASLSRTLQTRVNFPPYAFTRYKYPDEEFPSRITYVPGYYVMHAHGARNVSTTNTRQHRARARRKGRNGACEHGTCVRDEAMSTSRVLHARACAPNVSDHCV